MEALSPYRVEIGEREAAELRERLGRTRWPDAETVDDWSQGMPLAYARELCAYWEREYEMDRVARRLNAVPQFTTTIGGLEIHFLHLRSPVPEAVPLVLTHGWPGSVLEFVDLLGPLTDPESHGGAREDAFHVVVPSLPGYGFGGKPTETGWGVERIADAWAELMRLSVTSATSPRAATGAPRSRSPLPAVILITSPASRSISCCRPTTAPRTRPRRSAPTSPT